MLRWPDFSNTKTAGESTPEGAAINEMCKREMAQSAANCRALQKAKAAEARRLRAESIEAAQVLGPNVTAEFAPPKKSKE